MTQRASQRSYPSDHAATGYVPKKVANTSADAGVRIAELAAAIINASLDLDEDTQPIVRAANELSQIGVRLSDVQWNVADGNYSAAKQSALRLENGMKQAANLPEKLSNGAKKP